MPVQAIERHVRLAADEPLDLGGLEIPPGDLVPTLEPIDALGLLSPEAVGIGNRPVVQRPVLVERPDAGLLRERLRDLDEALSLGVRHGCLRVGVHFIRPGSRG